VLGKTNNKIMIDTVFTREYTDIITKIKHVWYYDLEKFPNGAYKTEIFYPSNFQSKEEELTKSNKKVSLTKQTWINPLNGKEVGYTRAKALGLIK
jgi:hypothetical protein